MLHFGKRTLTTDYLEWLGSSYTPLFCVEGLLRRQRDGEFMQQLVLEALQFL